MRFEELYKTLYHKEDTTIYLTKNNNLKMIFLGQVKDIPKQAFNKIKNYDLLSVTSNGLTLTIILKGGVK